MARWVGAADTGAEVMVAPVNSDRIARILELRETMSNSEIADTLGIKLGTLENFINLNGLARPRSERDELQRERLTGRKRGNPSTTRKPRPCLCGLCGRQPFVPASGGQWIADKCRPAWEARV